MADLLDELRDRGLLHQCTDEAALREHLARPRLVYAGFDPTAASLTIGNLVPIMLLKHFQRAGHTPVVVMGGGTGLIGDPSGKEAERTLRTPGEIDANIAGQKPIFERVLSFDGPTAAIVVNNLDWLGKLNYLEVLRDVGKHFSVNTMIQKESVKERLHNREQGISYTEFSYMILQAYDFLRLYEDRAVTVQLGGSDQWGNIVAGCELIRRLGFQLYEECAFENQILIDELNRHGHTPFYKEISAELNASLSRFERAGLTIEEYNRMQNESNKRAKHPHDAIPSNDPFASWDLGDAYEPREWKSFGLTSPLVTKSDGGKFGKTEAGAVWLTAHRTSPYAFYQFWVNTSDDDAERYLKLFTLLPLDEIGSIVAEHAKNPGARVAQRALAREVTRLIHGDDNLQRAENAARALFSGDVSSLDEATINEVFADVPSSEHARADLAGAGVSLVELLPRTPLAQSKREAREFLSNGAVSVNGAKAGVETTLTESDLLPGSVALIRRGKKAWHVTRWI